MSYIDNKYVSLVSNRLEKFKRVGQNWNFRCPYCGDSKTKKNKARGYFYSGKGLNFHCHNCNKHLSFRNFLKDQDRYLYIEYLKESMIASGTWAEKEEEPTKVYGIDYLKDLKKLSEMKSSHPAMVYIEKRQIPKKMYDSLYYAPKYKKWVNSIIPDKFEHLNLDEPRLVIPFIYKNRLIAFQGRSFDPKSGAKYITISLSKDKNIYGLDRLDDKQDFYVVEGPIDSMFLPNCIAVGNSQLNTVDNKDRAILVFDNQSRNKELLENIEKSIDQGWRVVIWPKDLNEKDINDMVLSNLNPIEIIKQNTYKGLSAKLKFNDWKKI